MTLDNNDHILCTKSLWSFQSNACDLFRTDRSGSVWFMCSFHKHGQPRKWSFTITWKNQKNQVEKPLGKLFFVSFHIKYIICCHAIKKHSRKSTGSGPYKITHNGASIPLIRKNYYNWSEVGNANSQTSFCGFPGLSAASIQTLHLIPCISHVRLLRWIN